MKVRFKKMLVVIVIFSCSLGFVGNADAMDFLSFCKFVWGSLSNIVHLINNVTVNVAESSINGIKIMEKIYDPGLDYSHQQQDYQQQSATYTQNSNTHAGNSSNHIFNIKNSATSDYQQTTALANQDTKNATYSVQTQGNTYTGNQYQSAQTASEISSGQYTTLPKLQTTHHTLATVNYESERKSQLALGSSSSTSNTNLVSKRMNQGGSGAGGASAKSNSVWANADNVVLSGEKFLLDPLEAVFKTFQSVFSSLIGAVSGMSKANGLTAHLSGTATNTSTMIGKVHHNTIGRQLQVNAENSGDAANSQKKGNQ